MSADISLMCVRTPGTLADLAIRAWDGDSASHVGIRLGDQVIDATLKHGVSICSLENWLRGRIVVDEVPIHARTPAAQTAAIERLGARIGQRYDWLEILGFVVLRDLGHPDRPICSRLAIDFITDACGLRVPGRQGRISPRMVRTVLSAYNVGLTDGMSNQPNT
jgi:hypothetical protein